MEKLIITNCAADCSMYPEWVNRFHRSDTLAQSVEAAWRAGAAIAHIHAPPADYSAWASHTRAIRDRCGIAIQYGISIQTIEQRRAVIANRPEMISVAVGAHNLVFTDRDLQMLHPRAELAELMRMCRDNGVKPEFEVCALGDLWLIEDLASQGLIDPPLMMTLFFGRPGGTWSRCSGSPNRITHFEGSGTRPSGPSNGNVGVTGRKGSPSARAGATALASSGCASSAPTTPTGTSGTPRSSARRTTPPRPKRCSR